jgi:hypothetical protein
VNCPKNFPPEAAAPLAGAGESLLEPFEREGSIISILAVAIVRINLPSG